MVGVWVRGGLAVGRLLVEGLDDLLDEFLVRILFQGSWRGALLLNLDVWPMPACVIKTNLEISSVVAVEVHERWPLNEEGSILGAVNLLLVRRLHRWLHASP